MNSDDILPSTPEQIAVLSGIQAKWLRHINTTEPVDHAEAEKSIGEFHDEMTGFGPSYFKPLDRIEWFPSAFAMEGSLPGEYNFVSEKSASAEIRRLLYNELSDRFWPKYPHYAPLFAAITYNLGVESKIWEDRRFSQQYSMLTDNLASAYCICYEYLLAMGYMKHRHGVFEALCKVMRSCGRVFLGGGTCLMSERPTHMLTDSDGLLHGDGAPALMYPDWKEHHFWHGVSIPRKYGFLPSAEWNPKWLLNEDNQELRRILIDVLGYERILSSLDGKKIDAREGMELWRIDGADIEPITLLKVTCPSTGSVYVLRVPPTATDCRLARNWTFHKDIDFIRET